MYIITNGERFVYRDRNGKFVMGSGELMAEHYSKKQAEKIIQNHLPRPLRRGMRIERVEPVDELIKPPDENEIKTNGVNFCDSEEVQRWIQRLNGLNGLAEDAQQRKEELKTKLSKVDKELAVLAHYIEFTKLNAAQGYKAYKMQQERFQRRREIKNELAVVSIILSKNIGQVASKEIENSIKAMDERSYEPKVLKELFDL